MDDLNIYTQKTMLKGLSLTTLQYMQTIAQNVLNPHRYHLSDEAKKRLKWIYLLEHEHKGNVTNAADNLGTSRQWLSTLKGIFERSQRDPRSLEPQSRAPYNTSTRSRVAQTTVDLILKERDASPGWGKEKIQRILWRDHAVKVGASTVNRYLQKHHRIDPKIARKNRLSWMKKKDRESLKPILKVKYRPPRAIKDYTPGALVEKDMKFIVKQGQFLNADKYKAKENFWYQQTMIDSFTRLRVIELTLNSESATTAQSYHASVGRFPFPVATINTDNGGENEKDFSTELNRTPVLQFYSSVSTPTDNPRVERSHLTDDKEFYQRGNVKKTFEDQQSALKQWEDTYNLKRPHQALGQLTPMEFYELWKKDPEAAQSIVEKYQVYLLRQRKRLFTTRRVKRNEQLTALMQFIDAKLNRPTLLNQAKQALINCQLCSWT